MFKLIENVLSKSFRQVSSPIMWLPFLLVAITKSLWMMLLFYSVQWPLNIVAGPLIRRFWGVVALHYPGHILWMDGVLSSTGVFFDVVIGAIATAWIIKLVFYKETISSGESESRSFIKTVLIFLFLLVIVQVGLNFSEMFLSKGISFLLTKLSISGKTIRLTAMVGSNILLTALFYSLISYIFPAVYDGKGLVKGIAVGIRMAVSLFVPTFLIVVLALSCFLPFILIKMPMAKAFLISSYLPEALLVVDVVAWLWAVVINTILNIIIVNIYIEERRKYEKPA